MQLTHSLRRQSHLHEEDGAVSWRRLVDQIRRHEHARLCNDRDWTHTSSHSTDLPRFKMYKIKDGEPAYIRAIQPHSVMPFVDNIILHSAIPTIHRRITEALWHMVYGQEEFGSRGGRQACLFAALIPQEPDSQGNTDNSRRPANQPRKVMYMQSSQPDHDCFTILILENTQKQKLTFFQSGSDAIILHANMAACSLEKKLHSTARSCSKGDYQRQGSWERPQENKSISGRVVYQNTTNNQSNRFSRQDEVHCSKTVECYLDHRTNTF